LSVPIPQNEPNKKSRPDPHIELANRLIANCRNEKLTHTHLWVRDSKLHISLRNGYQRLKEKVLEFEHPNTANEVILRLAIQHQLDISSIKYYPQNDRLRESHSKFLGVKTRAIALPGTESVYMVVYREFVEVDVQPIDIDLDNPVINLAGPSKYVLSNPTPENMRKLVELLDKLSEKGNRVITSSWRNYEGLSKSHHLAYRNRYGIDQELLQKCAANGNFDLWVEIKDEEPDVSEILQTGYRPTEYYCTTCKVPFVAEQGASSQYGCPSCRERDKGAIRNMGGFGFMHFAKSEKGQEILPLTAPFWVLSDGDRLGWYKRSPLHKEAKRIDGAFTLPKGLNVQVIPKIRVLQHHFHGLIRLTDKSHQRAPSADLPSLENNLIWGRKQRCWLESRYFQGGWSYWLAGDMEHLEVRCEIKTESGEIDCNSFKITPQGVEELAIAVEI